MKERKNRKREKRKKGERKVWEKGKEGERAGQRLAQGSC